jgi:predicted ATP-grasp superfamily ATP-dependent carboligase
VTKIATVLLTDGIQRKTLSVVRSLGRKGIQTVVGEKDSFSPAGCSRFCHQSFKYPDPETSRTDFFQTLLKQIDLTDCNVIFPMDDTTLSFIVTYRKELERKCLIPLPDDKSILIASDKYETFLLAKSSNVDCPFSFMPSSIKELKKLSNQLQYPIVIKPRKSSGSRGIRVARSKDDLLHLYKEVHSSYPFPMIQEYIPQGERYDVCLLYDRNHKIKCSFIQKEIRHFPIEMGPSTVQESVVFPELLNCTKRLLEKLNWVGVVEVEFMIDARSGIPKLMEINPRFWNSLELAIQCGVDFPHYLLKVAQNESFEGVFHYDIGKRTRWLIPGDILHFIANKNRLHMNPPFLAHKKNQLIDDSFLLMDPLPTIANLLACVRYGVKPKYWKMMFKR